MKYLFFCNSGEALPIAYRLKREGHSVRCYIHNPKFRTNYQGMGVEIIHHYKGRLVSACEEADLIIFDMNKAVEDKNDRALQATFKVKGDGTFGPIANKLRQQGKAVLGSSAYTEMLELDRNTSTYISRRVGSLKTPATHEFSSLIEGATFLKKSPKGTLWVFKPHENQDLDLTYVERYPGELYLKLTGEYQARVPNNIEFILQEKVDGIEISTEAWWTGKKWAIFNHTIEDKCMMNFDLGPRIGSANNTVWIKGKAGLLTSAFHNLTPVVREAGYIGPIDINAIVAYKDHQPYFLEFTPRLGYDAIYCLLTLLKDPIDTFFRYVAGIDTKAPRFRAGYASSIRISIPPYPYSETELLKQATGVDIGGSTGNMWLEDVYFDHGLKCAGADGIVGVVAMHGNSIGGSVGNVYKEIQKVKIGSYTQYRTDCGKRAKRAIKTFDKWGIEVD